MKTMRNIAAALVGFALLWVVVGTLKPFWDRYWLSKDLERAAVYATKNSPERTQRFLDRKMKDRGHGFSGEDFLIEKDQYKDVTISIQYVDEIRFFGRTWKELDFTVEAKAKEIDEYY